MTLDDGADGVQDISGRKIIPFCQLGPSCGLRVPLGLHDLMALVPKLEASRRVNSVVNAAVAGTETAQKSSIVCVYDRVHPQPGNIPFPDGYLRAAVDGGQRRPLHHTFGLPLGRQKIVLYSEKLPFQRHGRADIHQTAEQPPLTGRVLRKILRLRLVLITFPGF